MIKLPDEVTIASEIKTDVQQAFCNGYNLCLAEIQRLNATAQPVSDGWVKCSDRMPEEMSDVLVTDGKDVKDMWWNGKKWDSWAARYSLDSDSITHWMTLPAAPGGQDD